MRRRKKTNLQTLASFFDIPQDIVLDLPRITMLGNKQVLVENHKGIIEYHESLVRIKLSQGELIITGADLMLGNLQVEQIMVEGVIAAIRYEA
ncbi:MAG: sporulation protein YqfC [Negativicutes bacterium]|nr:sporulation protein YqfC [Negativicutes bacterium]